MERVRALHSSNGSAPETIGPQPSAHSLPVLLTMVRSPGVLQTHIDALVHGLTRPLSVGETPRARADFLLSLIEFPEVGHLQGHDGRTVRAAAVQALLELGYPYALEIPPEALSDASSAQEGARQGKFPFLGLLIALIGSLTGVSSVLKLHVPNYPPDELDLTAAAVMLGPTLLSVLGGLLRLRFLLSLGVAAMGLMGSYCLLLPFLKASLSFRFLVTALVTGLGLLLGSILLRPSAWLGEEESPKAEETPPTTG